MSNVEDFRTQLTRRIAATKTALCVGIDPHGEKLPPALARRLQDDPVAFLDGFSRAHVSAAAGIAPAVKFQSAFFEAFGAEGVGALTRAIRAARDAGLFTILDAKRGDISSTMRAYGSMAFDALGVDALTVTPYMGLDIVEPLVPWLAKGRGIYVVWVSSNAGGALVQDRVAAVLLDALIAATTEWNVRGGLGLVLGATKIDELPPDVAKRAATQPLLIPGVGAQGATVNSRLKALLASSPASLVPQSRSLSFPGAAAAALAADSLTWREYEDIVRGAVAGAAAALTP